MKPIACVNRRSCMSETRAACCTGGGWGLNPARANARAMACGVVAKRRCTTVNNPPARRHARRLTSNCQMRVTNLLGGKAPLKLGWAGGLRRRDALRPRTNPDCASSRGMVTRFTNGLPLAARVTHLGRPARSMPDRPLIDRRSRAASIRRSCQASPESFNGPLDQEISARGNRCDNLITSDKHDYPQHSCVGTCG